MSKDPHESRLHALDGLRAIAILLVLLSHLNATLVPRTTYWGSVLFDNGILGVSFLFLLSGFLMAYLYPHPRSSFAFLKKRYTRIFPLFITVSVSIGLLSFFPHNNFLPLALIIVNALFVHLFWVYGIKKISSSIVSNILFIGFLVIQAVSIGVYLWVMHHPAVFYYDTLSAPVRNSLILLVNSTLTLPFGEYVPMLDPVYWSLAAEVIFYILYIFIAVPVINYLRPKSRVIKTLFVISLCILFAGITLLLKELFNFSLIRFPLFYFFIGGMAAAYLYRYHQKIFVTIEKYFSKKAGILSVLLFLSLIPIARIYFHLSYSFWQQSILMILVTLVFFLVLSPKTLLAKMLAHRFLVFIGTISYSLYLTHMTVFFFIKNIFGDPQQNMTLIIFCIAQFVLTICVSALLYYLLEKPYFMRSSQIKKPTTTTEKTYTKQARIVLVGIPIVYLAVIFMVFLADVHFFSIEQRYGQEAIMMPRVSKNQQYISIKNVAVLRLMLPVNHDNLGLINLPLSGENVPMKKFAPQQITFKIKEQSAKDWYSISHYIISHRNQTIPVFYGFPTIAASRGHTFIVEVSLEQKETSQSVLFNTKNNGTKAISEVDKKLLVKDHDLLADFVINKIEKILYNPEVQTMSALSLPLIGFVSSVFIIEKSNVFNKKKKKK